MLFKDVEDAYPLTRLQAGMLFHSDYDSQRGLYHDFVAHAVRQRFDEAALRSTLEQLTQRHAILRTSFELARFREPLQLVHREVRVPLSVEDLRERDAAGQAAGFDEWMRAERARGFDLTVAPVLRMHAQRLSDAVFRLCISVHHAVLDGWSLASLVTELLRRYSACLAGRPLPLDPLKASFRDFVALEKRALESPESARFWAGELEGHLLTRVPRLPHADGRAGLGRYAVPGCEKRGADAERVARSAGVPRKTLLLAVHLKALSILSGQRAVTTGLVSSGRPETAGGDELLGLFLNSVPLRMHLQPGTWRELLRETLAREQAVFAHRRFPLPDIQQRHGEGTLFETLFNYTRFRVYDNLASVSDLDVLDRQGFEHSNYPFVAQAGSLGSEMGITLELDATEFGRAQGEEYARLYGEAITALLDTPDASHDARLFTSPRQLAAMASWNATGREYARRSLAQEFAEVASRRGAATALVELGADGVAREELTYTQLDERSNRLARRLRELGVGADMPVGVCVERSADLVVALLGILKAGGAYVSFDPDYPAQRLEFMLEDSGVGVLVVQEKLLARLPAYALGFVQTVSLDGERESLESYESSALEVVVGAEHLAYVTYTSGTTGRPKGVAVTQRGVLRLVKNNDFVEIGERDVFLHLAPVSFDASTLEIWGALLNGARLVLAPPEVPDLELLGRVLREQGVSVLWLTAPLFHLMVDACAHELRGVRQLLAGGDVLLPLQVRKHLSGLPEGHWLINGYGPTENTTFTACHRMRELGEGATSVPIGRPIANTRVHVLDSLLNPVPVGTPGELWAAGDGLARGYWGRAESSAESFRPDPWGEPGARMYRTGDLARWLADGTLEFLGRADAQVKVRGFRIEPGEVESALLRHASVQAAAVLARGEGHDKRLVAYVVPAEGHELTAGELQGFLKTQVPEYMVPTVYVPLEALPLTPSGKLDRKALPSPDEGVLGTGQEYVEPRTPAERTLCAIWAQVLGAERVGIEDNYFELGGDSILSIQIKAQAQAQGLDFALQDLFEHQTVRALAEAIAGGTSQVEEQVRSQPFELISPEARAALPEDVEDAYPLSQLQAGMLFHSELAPDKGVYHDIKGYTAELPFVPEALERTLAELAGRHSVLRTSVDSWRFGEPLQLVHRSVRVPVVVADLSAHDADGQRRLLDEFLVGESRNGFDWSVAPLFRVFVHVLGARAFQVSFSFHHALLDGWSIASFATEFFAVYAAALRHEHAPATGIQAKFADFVALERRTLAAPESIAFWDAQVAELPECGLPSLPGGHGEGVERRRVAIDARAAERLQTIAREAGVSVKAALLAVHLKALAVLTGRRDVVTGVVFNGRPETSGGERLLGLFLNTLPFRLALGAQTWSELLAAVFRLEREMLPHRRFPMPEIKRRLGGRALFESAFNFTHFHVYRRAIEEELPVQDGGGFEHSNFTFVVQAGLSPVSDEAYLVLETDRAHVGEAQSLAILEVYQQAFDALIAAPGARHDERVVVPAAQLEQLRAWNATGREYARRSLAQEFAEVASRRGAATALVELGADGVAREELTYTQLDERSNRLARRLRELGVGADMPVGVCVERSADLVVALLGILKAGGAYVSFDPDYPAQRLEFMLEDSGVGVLVVQEKLLARLPAYALGFVQTVSLDGERESLESYESSALEVVVGAEHLAYVTYTSGTTGRPKGVAVTQRGVLRLVKNNDFVEIGERDVFLHLAPVSFDASTLEIWGALLNGARLVLAPPEVPDLELLGRVLREQGVSVLWLTAPLFHLMVDACAHELRGVRQLLAGGDVLLPLQVRKHLSGLPEGHWLINGYGPTENTTFTACHRMRELGEGATSVPIGRPIANTRVHVLDSLLNPVPVGTPGELWAAGDGLARGYWGRAESSAESFRPDPWGEPGARMYRTGDLARWLADGTLEFLGRADAQVKVRGFRIEPGEVESALLRHASVQAAAVLARGEGHDKRLVAYVVPAEGHELTAGELQGFLKTQVPEYMVPTVYVPLEALPLTPSGKLDRKALPSPDEGVLGTGQEYVEPRTPAERTLCAIWAQVLGAERVGIEDNYFELGGDSILSIQIKAQAQAQGLDFALQDLFEHQTVRALAEAIAGGTSQVEEQVRSQPFELISQEARAALPEDVEDAYPLSQLQAGMVYHSERGDVTGVYHDVITYLLELPFDEQALDAALVDLSRRHEVLRTSFDLTTFAEPLQLVWRQARLPLLVSDLRGLRDERQREQAVSAALEQARARPFEWARPPLLRVHALRLGDERFQLVLDFHHAVLDGWSEAALFTELLQRYQAHRAAAAPQAPALRACYRDYIALERQALADARAQAHWDEVLRDFEVTRLPRLRPGAPAGAPLTTVAAVPSDVSRGLWDVARTAGAPIKSVLLAVHVKALGVLTGQRDVVTGVVSHGRPELPDGERVLGLFLNTLPFRQRLAGGSWLDLVRSVFRAEQAAQPHRRYPMPALQRRHGPRALFETAFNYTNFHVYGELASGDVEKVRGRGGLAATNFALAANFLLPPGSSSDLVLSLECAPDVCDQERLEELRDLYLRAMAGLAAEARAAHDAVTLVPEGDARRLAGWSSNPRALDLTPCVHELFAEQARRAPHAPAVVERGETLTYAQLEARANALAHELRARGVGPDSVVGLLLERSTLALQALLGVLKAGGAYLTLDPAYPDERLQFMLDDAGVSLAVTRSELVARLPATVTALALDERREEHPAVAPPSVQVGSGHLSHVIYTSGSTGRPKGVALTHRGLVNLFSAQLSAMPLRADDRVLQLASLSFDGSVWETWSAFCVGAALVVAERDQALEPAALAELVRGAGVTVAMLPPSLLARLDPADFPGLRVLLVGGEACPASLAERWAAGRDMFNGYGPTETTCYVSLERFEPPLRGLVSIGRPVANTHAHVLDAALNQAPVGTAGELYVGGEGLARGYRRRPELTAERFVPDPHGSAPGARLYRTGDLARWLPDGRLEYLGRLDAQLKVRGLRIEPGEVEEALRRHARVRDAVVIARGEGATQHLVAYTVSGDAQPPSAEELQAHLRAELPEYLVPNAYVALAVVPRTTSGKVDRRALPLPESHLAERAYDPPRTPTEARLAAIWGAVLGLERVSRDDDFFALGGHSLLATQVVSRVRAALRVELPLRELFGAPTPARLATVVDAALAARGAGALPPLVPARRPPRIPLSYAQQRLWFLEQLDPGSAAYNVPLALRLRGRLDAAALERALSSIVARHESLRTRLVAEDGGAWQVVDAPRPCLLERRAFEGLSTVEREAELQRWLASESARPFDLRAGALLRASLGRLQDDEHVLLVCAHHAVIDGLSMPLLLAELAGFYRAESTGIPFEAPALPVHYADYALWQREWLRGEALESQLAYWERQLAGAPGLALPLDRQRPASKGARGATHALRVSGAVAQALQDLARSRGATPFMALLAAFQLVLGRWAGQDDVSVGMPVAGRTRQELEGLIGFFVNTLVVRTALHGVADFGALVVRVRDTVLDGLAHQDVPFEQVVDRVQPLRDLSTTPLFQVLFQMHASAPAGAAPMTWPDLEVVPQETGFSAAKFDLSLALGEVDGGGLGGALEYDADLFEPATVGRLASYLVAVLERVARTPEAPLSALTALPVAERDQVLYEWNATRRDYPAGGTLPGALAEQAGRTPHAVALVRGETRLTYAQALERAHRLAHVLRARGVGPETRVGVCLPREPDLVVALWAVLAAGGAYVPLDPAYPAERLAYMLSDSDARLVLTSSELAERVTGGGAQVLALDACAAELAAAPTVAPEVRVEPDQLAYVIYTSGSTGRPKGVAIAHRSAVTLLHWGGETFTSAELRGTLFSTSVCFDLSVYEIFLPLRSGGCVIVARDLLELAEGPVGAEVTLVNTVPSALTELLRLAGLPRSVTTVNLAGEALTQRLVQAAYATGHVERVYNLYGPSEDTTYSTFALIARDDERPPSIGRPLANTQAYLLDTRVEPVPVGSAGELYLGGDGLARGYLGRAELTAERFVPDPFGARPGARLYRTGDLARWRADGTLDFLGRADHQIKLRGFRIELGEIEAALATHASVQDVVVLAREERAGDRRLVAYVVPRAVDVSATELRAHLRTRLPEHMLPSAIVTLAALPRTPNGKLDRRALPAPSSSGGEQRAHVAARSALEQALVAIWSEVLGVSSVGVHDDFFALGGHSLLATQVVARVRAVFGVELPLREIFTSPTVAGLAQVLEAGGARAGAPALTRRAREARIPLSYAQQRLWFLEQLDPGSAAYNLPLALRLAGALDVRALERALSALAARHASLRTRFVVSDGEPYQVIDPELPVALAPESLEALPGEAREAELLRRLAEESARPFDLSAGPPMRARLWRLAADEHALLLALHHAASDGWSNAVLLRDLDALYARESGRPAATLPGLPIDYADYALWQRAWLQGEALESQLAYWERQLAGAATLELPSERPRPALKGSRSARHELHLDLATLARLRALAQHEKATLAMTLLAAFQALLGRRAGQDDVSVGLPVAGRSRRELEGLVGFFVNTLVVRSDVRGTGTFRALMRRVRDTLLDALAHQDVPFEQVVNRLRPVRDLSTTPLFQAMFDMLAGAASDAPAPARLGDLRLGAIPLPSSSAKFDVSLVFAETAGGLDGVLEYDADLFAADGIARLCAHLSAFVTRAAERPDAPLRELLAPPEDELAQLLAWNATARARPEALTFQAAFAQQARRTPDAPAVAYSGEVLTFAQLDARANRLARLLRARGAGPERLVGLYLERSLELIVGLLAVLKAGAAYVPLDPALPAERLRFMIADAGLALILSGTREQAHLPATDAAVACWDEAAVAGLDAADLGPIGTPDQLAYVIYTSGSTGRPKGVAVTHRSLHNLRLALAESCYARYGRPLRLSLNAPLAFDASLEPLVMLLEGHALHVLPQDTRADERLLLAALERDLIDVLDCTPSQMRVLLQAESAGAAPLALTAVVLGGEAVDAALWDDLRRRGGTDFYNTYGPTEATVDATSTLILAADERPHIGRPLGNVACWVVDRDGARCAVGVAGELWIGGDGVARGYLGRPDLTAERFVPDPWGGTAGARLYRSGDRARWRADGVLEFLGRIDQQVKLRGFRIELGEIEAALATHAGVAEAAVALREDRPGEQRLVAYLVSADAAAPTPAELRAHLATRLPEYMLPSAYVALPALPATPSGKLDRRALPAPEHDALAAGDYVAPRTETERLLADIWAGLLGLPRVGANDDFFALGGHSLLATQVASRVRAAFGVELPLRELFMAPTLAGLAVKVEQARAAGPAPAGPPLVRRARPERLPLSYAQQRLWFLEQLTPGSPAYNLPLAVRLDGALDPCALAGALHELCARHEALRTRLVSHEGQPWQVIAPELRFDLTPEDLTGLAAAERQAELVRRLALEAARPFDLEAGPLLRARLYRLATEEHVLLVATHHSVFDGWSSGIFLAELSVLYARACGEAVAALPEPALQYADYALWQREWLAGGELERQLAYWQARLAGAPALALPLDRPRPAVKGTHGGGHAFVLGPALADGLVEVSRRAGATPFITVLAAVQALLGHWAGQDDVSVGTPVAGRQRQELEGLIGLLVNTLVLRGDLTGDPRFEELVARTRDVALGAFAHQDVPFEQVVERVQPARDLASTPLFQVLVQLEQRGSAGSTPATLGGLRLRPEPVLLPGVKFDLMLAFEHGPEGLGGAISFDADLFETATIERLAGRLASLLERAVARPQARLSELTAPDEAERRTVLGEWNATGVDFAERRTLPRLIEAQVARTPDAPALRFEGAQLCYRELNERANRLARELRRRGVAPEALVGVCLERSPELVVALLAVLKAGAAYVPLDPSYPRERLSFMLADARVALIVTQEPLAGRLPDEAPETLCLAPGWSGAPESDASDLPGDLDDARLAYVIFTSGSTGRPKGVMNTHGGIRNRLLWMQAQYGIGPTDRVLQKTPFGFDVSVWEFFWPLMTGACLVLARPGGHQDPDYLVRLLVDEGVTTLHFVPSMLRVFLEAQGVERCTRLKRVICSGEALPHDLQQRFFERLDCELHNLYGPTEAAVDVSYWACRRDDARRLVPIGRPVANTQLYVLDRRLEALPVGIVGELYIGGLQVARGYVERPELTAERFLPDPFAPLPGARLYRTGDLARWLADGALDFLGRADQQVKIRGQRIELGEIEAALRLHPSVREAAVVARAQRTGEQRLAAYLVCDAPPTAAELRAFLAARLPEAMLPTAYVPLAALPSTSSGKLDRQALPDPEHGALALGAVYVEPRGPAEELVARAFAELLGVERVGANDDFFALGGHSLLATRLMARVTSLLGVELPLRELFAAPTVAGLARVVEEARAARKGLARPAIVPLAHDGPLPLSYAQQRLWLLDQLEPGSAAYNVPLALRLRGALDEDALSRALDLLVERHAVLRTRFVMLQGEPRQVIDAPRGASLQRHDLSASAPEQREPELEQRLAASAATPFDLAQGPMLRADLFRLDAREHVLLINLHHIACDGWSTDVLLRDLGAAYEAFARGQQPLLPALPVQYADYAVWQRAWLTREVLEEQLAHWQRQLADAPALGLRSDRPRPAIKGYRGAAQAFEVPAETAAALRALAQREGATLFMVLLAAYQTLLGSWSGQHDVSVGVPSAGRARTELEHLVGFFVNTLVLRADLSGDPPFVELLRRARAAALLAYENQDVPFEELVERLQPVRDMSRTPLFQAMFQLQVGAPAAPASAAGPQAELELQPVSAGFVASKFDLSLTVSDGGAALRGVLTYDVDLYEAQSAERLTTHLVELLGRVAGQPTQRLSALCAVAPAERERVLREWNATSRPRPAGAPQTLPAAVAAQAERTPEALAVVCREATLTYAQLVERSERLARRLRAAGAGPGRRVGVGLERSTDMLVGVLGVLASGAAYVPLDPSYPAERLRFMLRDSGASSIVTQGALMEAWRPSGLPLLDVASPEDAPVTPGPVAGAADLAYVIYTSGSTGRPKGVGVEHRSLLNLAHALRAALYESHERHAGRPLRVSLNAPLSFDGSVKQLVTLSMGHTLVVVPEEARLAAPALLDYLQRQQVDVLDVTPSQLEALLEASAADGRQPAREAVLVGGEALDPALWRELSLSERPVYYNVYGPTECTVDATAFALTPGSRVGTLGGPLANVRVYVVGAGYEPVAVGAPGELLIGGAGVARGYLGRPDLTAERFVPDPFATQPGLRLYRTGDLARWHPDGTLEFLGRADGQVKVRGFRIELGEIEAALRAHPQVAATAVVVDERPAGERRLVAYVVPAGESAPTVLELRAFLAERLPDHMLPAAFQTLPALPLTPSGKLDRRALPTVTGAGLQLGAPYVAPRTATERELVLTWQELLGVERVGVEDDFFALGGHSLLAVKLVARLRERYGVELTLAGLFQRPTVAALAEALEAPSEARRDGPLVPLRPLGRRTPLFLVHAVGGGVLAYHELARALPEGRPLYGLERPGLESGEVEYLDVEQLAARYLEPLLRRQPHGPYALAGWSFGGLVAFEMARQLEASGARVALLGLIDTLPPVGRAVGLMRTLAEGVGLTRADLVERELRVLGDPAALDPRDVARLRAVLEAHVRASRRYWPRDGIGAERVVLLRAAETEASTRRVPLAADWQAFSRFPIDEQLIAGDHYSILQRPYVALLAAALGRALESL